MGELAAGIGEHPLNDEPLVDRLPGLVAQLAPQLPPPIERGEDLVRRLRATDEEDQTTQHVPFSLGHHLAALLNGHCEGFVVFNDLAGGPQERKAQGHHLDPRRVPAIGFLDPLPKRVDHLRPPVGDDVVHRKPRQFLSDLPQGEHPQRALAHAPALPPPRRVGTEVQIIPQAVVLDAVEKRDLRIDEGKEVVRRRSAVDIGPGDACRWRHRCPGAADEKGIKLGVGVDLRRPQLHVGLFKSLRRQRQLADAADFDDLRGLQGPGQLPHDAGVLLVPDDLARGELDRLLVRLDDDHHVQPDHDDDPEPQEPAEASQHQLVAP